MQEQLQALEHRLTQQQQQHLQVNSLLFPRHCACSGAWQLKGNTVLLAQISACTDSGEKAGSGHEHPAVRIRRRFSLFKVMRPVHTQTLEERLDVAVSMLAAGRSA